MTKAKTAALGVALLLCAWVGTQAAEQKQQEFDPLAADAVAFIDKGFPPDFRGIDDLKFVRQLLDANKGIEKSQFETQQEFEKRAGKALKTKIAPITLGTVYPFSPAILVQTYNADKEVSSLVITVLDWDYGPHHHSYSGFELGTWVVKRDSYIGQNSFNVSTEVKREIDVTPVLAAPRSNPVLRLAGLQFAYGTGQIDLRIHWPRSEAKATGGDNPLGVLFLGRLSSAVILDVDNRRKPTIESPVDVTEKKYGFDVDLREIVVYVKTTGKVLKRIRVM